MAELADLEVLIVDCQTTGATPALGAVLELGWGALRPSQPGLDQREHAGPGDAHHDRLHVLSRELKRVQRDQGSVAVYVAPGRRLGGRVLQSIFESI